MIFMKSLKVFILFFVLVASLVYASLKGESASPGKPNLLPVPIIRQATNFSCGSASLLSVLYYWNATNEGELALHGPLQTHPDFGTHPVTITEHAKSLGLKAELKTNVSIQEIESAINLGEPVIVGFQAWGNDLDKQDYSVVWDSGHYSVIVGYDKTMLYFMDPVLATSYGKLTKQDFLNRWHDFETRNGKIEYYIHSAIFIRGNEKLNKFPSDISFID